MTTESSAIIQRWCAANGVPKTTRRVLRCQYAGRNKYGHKENRRFCVYCPDADRAPCALDDGELTDCDYCALEDCPCMAETTPERTAAYASWAEKCATGTLKYSARNVGWAKGPVMYGNHHYTKGRTCEVCGKPIANQTEGDLCRTHWHEVRWGEKARA